MGSESTPQSNVPDPTVDPMMTSVDGIDPDTVRHGADLPPGTLVGDYQIERKIGHGGMGSVYEAFHSVIEKRVAVKVLLPELSRNEEAVERFKTEARAVNRIRHPSIVDVFGYGTTEDGRCFLVMELLAGESLGRRLQYDAPSISESCDILTAITHALDAAHATGIVHRDLKPDNVFLVDREHVKLLDFGIAKLTASNEQRIGAEYTQPGQAMGTPRYIAPEQARGDAVDGRTDIYSLGVLAFELLVGRLPFVGDNAMELIAKHITLTPPTPSELAPTLPPVADRLLLQMLDKDPANRPTLAAIRDMLEEIRAPWLPPVRDSRLVTVAEGPRRSFAWDPDRPKRNWLLISAITLSIVAGVTTFVVIRALKEPIVEPAVPPPPTPEPVKVEVKREPAPEPVTPAVIEPVTEPVIEPPVAVAREPVKPPPPKSRRPVTKPVVVEQPTPPPIAPPPPPVVAPPQVDTTRDALKKPTFKP